MTKNVHALVKKANKEHFTKLNLYIKRSIRYKDCVMCGDLTNFRCPPTPVSDFEPLCRSCIDEL